MDRRSRIVLIIFGLVLAAITISELVRPRPIDWRPSYTAEAKIPFGCYVLYHELPGLFPGHSVERVGQSLYNVLSQRAGEAPSNYLLINGSIELDGQETQELLDYVARGSTVFIAASSLGTGLSDSLNLAMASDYGLLEGSASLTLTHEGFDQGEYPLARGNFNTHFTQVDSARTTVLGHISYRRGNALQGRSEELVRRPNLIRTEHGKGYFIISSTPQAYANYYILGGHADYVAGTLSYLGEREVVYWDDYKKAGRAYIDSPMRFVLGQAPLKWAYYLTLSGLLLFVLFRAKRQQRIIPLMVPPENSSVEFARTVGTLYYQHGDHTDLIQKKTDYFLAELREAYHLDTSTLDERTIGLLAAKAGKGTAQTKALIEYILLLKGKGAHTEAESLELNKKITAFKQK